MRSLAWGPQGNAIPPSGTPPSRPPSRSPAARSPPPSRVAEPFPDEGILLQSLHLCRRVHHDAGRAQCGRGTAESSRHIDPSSPIYITTQQQYAGGGGTKMAHIIATIPRDFTSQKKRGGRGPEAVAGFQPADCNDVDRGR